MAVANTAIVCSREKPRRCASAMMNCATSFFDEPLVKVAGSAAPVTAGAAAATGAADVTAVGIGDCAVT